MDKTHLTGLNATGENSEPQPGSRHSSLKVSEDAKVLDIDQWLIQRMILQGDLRAITLGRVWHIRLEAIEHLSRRRESQPCEDEK